MNIKAKYELFAKLLGESRVTTLRKAVFAGGGQCHPKTQKQFEAWFVGYMEEGLNDYLVGLEEEFEAEEE